jgi:hypothetical protein
MTLEQATRAVGRAMIGDFMTLQRYGIFVERNIDVLDQLSARFQGEAGAAAQSFTGQMKVMNAEWDVFKRRVGAALIEGLRSSGFLEKLSDGIAALTALVEENRDAIAFWAQAFKYLFLGLITLVASVTWGFLRLTSVVEAFGTVIVGIFKAMPNLFKASLATLLEESTKVFKVLAELFDKVFHTSLADRMQAIIDRFTSMRQQAAAGLKTTATETKDQVKDILVGGPVDTEPSDATIGHSRIPRARYLQQIGTQIGQLRGVAFGQDEQKSLDAVQKLHDLRADLVKQAEELKEQDGDTLGYDKKIADIDKVLLDLDNKRTRLAKDARGEAELTHRISLLRALAEGRDAIAAKVAMYELNKLHGDLLEKLNHQQVGSAKYLETLNHIRDVEDAIAQTAAKADQEWNTRVKRLAQRIDFGIDAGKAEAELLSLYRDEQKVIDDLVASGDQSLETQDKIIAARLRQVAIEQAMRDELEKEANRAKDLIAQLGNPETRAAAERQLVSIRQSLNKKLEEGTILTARQADANALVLEITTALNDQGAINLRNLGSAVNAAEELIKHGSTRKEGLAGSLKLEEQITAALARGNLTVDERIRLEALRKKVQENIRKGGEPELNPVKELKRIYKEELPALAQGAAGQMANSFTTAFALILRDSRNLRKGLESIPRGMAAAMTAELAKLASSKVQEQLAWAIEETAHGIGALATGNLAGAGTHFASAGEHVAAAAAWGLLGGAASSLNQSANTAYGNTVGNPTGNRGSQADNSRQGGDIYLYIDGVDPKNPRHQQLIGDTQREYQQRYGGRIILMASGGR